MCLDTAAKMEQQILIFNKILFRLNFSLKGIFCHYLTMCLDSLIKPFLNLKKEKKPRNYIVSNVFKITGNVFFQANIFPPIGSVS